MPPDRPTSDDALAAAAKEARAWPFEEARRLVKRLETLQGWRRQDGDLRDRLRALRPAAHRHVRRGGAHGHGAPRLRGADRGQAQDAADLLLRRHGRPAQGARQRAQQGHAGSSTSTSRCSSVPDPFSNEYPSFAAHNNARLRRFLDHFGFEYEFFSATECYKAGLFDATLLKMLKVYDKVMDIILPTLGPERRATYSPFLPVSPTLGQGAAGADGGAPSAQGHHRLRRPRHGQEGRDAGHGRARQVPVEGRLGAALDGARRRLRDVRQGPDRLGHAVLEDLPGARRHAAGELHLRAVPRPGRRQDLQVQGQRADHRGVADLRLAGEPVAVHVPEAEGGQAAILRRDPEGGR